MGNLMLTFEIKERQEKSFHRIFSIGSFDPIDMLSNLGYVRKDVVFGDGTSFYKDHGYFVYDKQRYNSLDDLFPLLSEDVMEVILFNIDVFRRL